MGSCLAGLSHLRVQGKGGELRYVPAHPGTLEPVHAYLEAAGHRDDLDGPLFRPLKSPPCGTVDKPLCGTTVYLRIVRRYARQIGLSGPR
jgi:integrase/recombinase XerD